MLISALILCKEGVTVEEMSNPTSAGNIPSYVIRKDGRGICEVFKRDLAVEIGLELVRERVEGRDLKVAHAKRG